MIHGENPREQGRKGKNAGDLGRSPVVSYKNKLLYDVEIRLGFPLALTGLYVGKEVMGGA